ncbi:TPA: hypothetical protein MYR17_003443 [Citrobacter koseri]|uniref:hypothetical protein n=1 Tax=Citrobacter koseri TaxID=545 RepID=UPI001DBE592D|nr:hypothetical protein [Citrobacter koseri]MDT7497134.1 hypothetical protein [Citrobacter koseri]CAG0297611.1 hypothetical protein AN2351V1_4281 [Citrobacter koseri]CAH6196764.1 hypothetical protein AN2351V1_4281 [Citrobacter koseri]HCB2272891.1 hypothetical protein [Citrobacter koseri]
MTTSDIIASIALLVTIIGQIRSEYKSKKNDSEQRLMRDEQDRLRKLLLEKETKSAISEMKAELGARIVKISRNNYKLKIFNRGKVEARKVEIIFPDNDGDEYLVMRDVHDKFPYQVLHPQHGIEIIAHISFESKSKYRIILKWEDDFSRSNDEEFIVSI